METEPVPLKARYMTLVPMLFLMGNPSSLGMGFGLLILLVCSALVSGSEVAFFSLDDRDMRKLEKKKTKVNKRLLDLLRRPRYLLATILISNNFVNIAIVILSTILLNQLLTNTLMLSWAAVLLGWIPALESLAPAPQLADGLNFGINVVGVTFLLVLFGEVAPKVYANLNNLSFAKMMATPIGILLRIFYLASSVLVQGVFWVERQLEKRANSTTSRQDIDAAIDLTMATDERSQQERDLLRSIVTFGDVPVKHIMCARVDIIALDIVSDYQMLLDTIKDSGYSRIPIYENDLDNVTGILYAKDLIGHLDEGVQFEWQKLIRTGAMFVPEAKKIDDLLREFQSKRTHMAVVVDEYGGSAGIVTLEDILEEIIGEIRDEFDDEPEVEFKKIDERHYEFEGKTLLNDFCRVIGVDTTTFDTVRGESDSLAGMLLQVTGRFPKKKEVISLGQYTFKVTTLEKRRIKDILVTLPQE